jgi:hypothetical protein
MGGSSTGGTQEKIGGQQRANATYMANMAKDKTSALYGISQGQLSPYEQQMFQQQLAAVEAGQTGAAQQIEQTTREGATSRGLFSSRGAISEEANQLANLPLQRALQLSGIYSNQATLSREGVLQGMALRGNLLSGSGNMYSGASQTYQAAEQANQAQNQALMQGAMGAAQLGMGLMTGGASTAVQTGMQNFSNQNKLNLNNSYAQNIGNQQVGSYIYPWGR